MYIFYVFLSAGKRNEIHVPVKTRFITNQKRTWDSLAGAVIQANGTVEFKDDMRMGILPVGC